MISDGTGKEIPKKAVSGPIWLSDDVIGVSAVFFIFQTNGKFYICVHSEDESE